MDSLAVRLRGARVNEMTQLRGSDVRETHGIWVVRITPQAGSVKTGRWRTFRYILISWRRASRRLRLQEVCVPYSMTQRGLAAAQRPTQSIRRWANGLPRGYARWASPILASIQIMAGDIASRPWGGGPPSIRPCSMPFRGMRRARKGNGTAGILLRFYTMRSVECLPTTSIRETALRDCSSHLRVTDDQVFDDFFRRSVGRTVAS